MNLVRQVYRKKNGIFTGQQHYRITGNLSCYPSKNLNAKIHGVLQKCLFSGVFCVRSTVQHFSSLSHLKPIIKIIILRFEWWHVNTFHVVYFYSDLFSTFVQLLHYNTQGLKDRKKQVSGLPSYLTRLSQKYVF